MKILAIDPGSKKSGWLLFDGRLPVEFGTRANEDIAIRLRGRPYGADILAIEMFGAMGFQVGQDVFDSCVWIGRFLESFPGPVRLVKRQKVKAHILKKAKGNDAAIVAALIARYGPGKDIAVGTQDAPGALYGITGHEWQALATAITAYETSGKVIVREGDGERTRIYKPPDLFGDAARVE